MAALKAQKELELKLHEKFYKNVHILTLVYPPSKDFKDVFKKDMFVKNNKAGFQQVVYYLLNILDPDKFKQKVSAWPPYDIRLENQFRNEVMRYINELGTIYENANIPQLATSHLISPGGFKFVKFMFKLSQFIFFEHLHRNSKLASNMLLPIKPCKKESATYENLEKLKKITDKINNNTEVMKENYKNRFEVAKFEAQNIIKEQFEASKQFKENQVKLELIRKESDNSSTDNEQNNIKDEVDKEVASLRAIKEKFLKCEALNSLLNSSNVKLEHNEEIKIPSEVSKIVRVENGVLDVSSLLEGCCVLNDRKRFEVEPLTDKEVLKQTEIFAKLNKRLVLMNEDLDQLYSELSVLSEKLQNKSTKSFNNKRHPLKPLQLVENDSDSTGSTVLAVPLSPSPSPKNDCNFIFNALI